MPMAIYPDKAGRKDTQLRTAHRVLPAEPATDVHRKRLSLLTTEDLQEQKLHLRHVSLRADPAILLLRQGAVRVAEVREAAAAAVADQEQEEQAGANHLFNQNEKNHTFFSGYSSHYGNYICSSLYT